jgi:hypothetical protein
MLSHVHGSFTPRVRAFTPTFTGVVGNPSAEGAAADGPGRVPAPPPTNRCSPVIDELHEVLAHQRDAAQALEGRLRAVELLLAAGEPRFLALAVDEATAASERLAALEVTRALTLTALGAPVDVTASEVVDAAGGEASLPFVGLVADLRATIGRVTVRREQVRALLAAAQAGGAS